VPPDTQIDGSIAILPFGKPPVVKSVPTLILYPEITSLCDSAVVNFLNGTRRYMISFKTLV
jgi:hypothetical protein